MNNNDDTNKRILPEDFLIRVNPHLTSEGKWNGGVEVAIHPNADNPLDDEDYFQVEHICRMICATLHFLETDNTFREKIGNYVVKQMDSEAISNEGTINEKKWDNVVSIDFKKPTKH